MDKLLFLEFTNLDQRLSIDKMNEIIDKMTDELDFICFTRTNMDDKYITVMITDISNGFVFKMDFCKYGIFINYFSKVELLDTVDKIEKFLKEKYGIETKRYTDGDEIFRVVDKYIE